MKTTKSADDKMKELLSDVVREKEKTNWVFADGFNPDNFVTQKSR